MAPPPRAVFVTVGTTRFDELVDAMDQPQVADTLAARGYTHLVMQIGDCAREPWRLAREGRAVAADAAGALSHLLPPSATIVALRNGLTVAWFAYALSLAPLVSAAALVVSHAGAGSVFETLRAGAALVAVPNPRLMDDHQAELARKLESEGLARAATLDTLPHVLHDLEADTPGRRRYDPGDAAGIVAAVDAMMFDV